MTIDEAIKLLSYLSETRHVPLDPPEWVAMNLAIEALELLSKLRRYDIEPACERLPEETKE